MRPRRCRRVWREPAYSEFRSPSGYWKETVNLTVDEFESLRLKHLKKLDQLEACKGMNISQPTFHRILESAHEKITRALQDGCSIKITGGDYMTEDERKRPERIRSRYFVNPIREKGGENMTEENKGVPKRDGSGQGARANRGRGGCEPPEDKNNVWCRRPERMRRRRFQNQ